MTQTETPVLYTISVADHTGHNEIIQNLDDTIETLIKIFKEKVRWVVIENEKFQPEGLYNDTVEDAPAVAKDRLRLRSLILGNTRKLPATSTTTEKVVTPAITAIGALRGGLIS